MTGTAMTEANEFWKIYKLDVVAIPTNMPLHPRQLPRPRLPHREGEVGRGRRRDRRGPQDRPADPDRHHRRRQVARSSASMLKRRGIKHELLNAKPENVGPRGRDRRPGRPHRRGDHRHQHGRPRHRHHPRRQPRDAGLGAAQGQVRRRASTCPRTCGRRRSTRSRRKEKMKEEGRKVAEMGGLHIVGTERHDSRPHRQPAPRPRRPAGRPRLAAGSTCRCKTT